MGSRFNYITSDVIEHTIPESITTCGVGRIDLLLAISLPFNLCCTYIGASILQWALCACYTPSEFVINTAMKGASQTHILCTTFV